MEIKNTPSSRFFKKELITSYLQNKLHCSRNKMSINTLHSTPPDPLRSPSAPPPATGGIGAERKDGTKRVEQKGKIGGSYIDFFCIFAT